MSQLYPLFADISGRRVLLVGGGNLATEKIDALLASEADVVVVSPEISEKLQQLVDEDKVTYHKRCYETGDVDGAWLVMVAVNNDPVHREIHAECVEKSILCNVVDVTELCIFQVPAICRQGPLSIAISTSGTSPAMAKRIKNELNEQFDPAYEVFLNALKDLRPHFKQKFADDLPKRSKIFECLVNSGAMDLIREGKHDEFDHLIQKYKNDCGVSCICYHE